MMNHEDAVAVVCVSKRAGTRKRESVRIKRPPAEHEAHGQRALRLEIDRAVVHDHLRREVLRGDKIDLKAVERRVTKDEELDGGQQGLQSSHGGWRV